MTQSQRKEQREKTVKENSSNFVEGFSKHCMDSGITKKGIGIQLFPKSKQYRKNFDRIFGKPSSEGNSH